MKRSVDKKKIIKDLRDKKQKKPVKKNITFRFYDDLIEDFKADCEKEGFSMNSVIEKLIEDFIEQ
jgi:hypothetical protein